MANLSNRNAFRVLSFNAGQYSTHEPATVPDNAASAITNYYIDKIGQAVQVEGLARTGDNPDTLISNWNFNDSTSDDIKGSNDGTDTNIVYTDGKFGIGAKFNATTSKITIPADSTIDFTTIGPFVISCWIYPNSDGGGDEGRIWSKGNHYAYVGLESSSTVKLGFVVDYGAGTDAVVVTSTTIPTGTWSKVSFHYNADESLDIYINGALASYTQDDTGSGTIDDDSADNLIIGNDDGTHGFDGMIDDFRLYDGAVSAAQSAISKVYGLTRFRVPGVIDKLYRIVGGSLQVLATDFKSWTDIDTGFTANKVTNFVIGRATDGTYRLVVANGTDNVHTVAQDGTTVTDEGNTNTDCPITSQIEWHDNRLFAINSVGDINYSDILDVQTFDRTTNIFRSKSPAKAIKSFKEKQLIIYGTKGIEVLDTNGSTPLSDWSKTVLNADIEFNSPQSVVNLGDDQIFLARDGVRILSRTQFDKIQSGIISRPIQDIIDSINQDSIDKACGWLYNNRYYLAIPTGTATENNTVIVWDAIAAKNSGNIENGWTTISDWNVSRFSDFEFGDNKLTLVVGDNRALSFCYRHAGNTNNGAAIVSEIIGVEHFVDGVSDGIFDPIQVIALGDSATTIDIQAEVNRGGFISVDSMVINSSAPVLPIALPFDLGGTSRVRKLFRSKGIGRGRSIRLKLRHTMYDAQPTITEYVVYVRKLNARFT